MWEVHLCILQHIGGGEREIPFFSSLTMCRIFLCSGEEALAKSICSGRMTKKIANAKIDRYHRYFKKRKMFLRFVAQR